MVEFITGQAGSGKTTLMFEKIRNDSRPKCIIVPEQFSHDFDKKLYYFLGAEKFNELFSLTFTSLARQLFQLYGDPSRSGDYADEMAKMILIYQAVNNIQSMPGGLNFFRSGHSGFAEDVLKLIGEMKRAGLTPEALMERSQMFDDRLRFKTSDIAMIYMEYQRLMNEYGFKDSIENIKVAAEIAELQGYFRGRSVYLDEFESFTADQIAMLRVMISSAENVCIALRTDDVTAGRFTLFETVNKTYEDIKSICTEFRKETVLTECSESYRFISPDIAYLSSRVLRNKKYSPEEAPKPDNIRIFEARDMYSEVEYVSASIKRLIHSRKDLRYRDIAVISNDITAYAGIIKAAFKRYDIPYFLSVEKPVTHTAVMVYFTSLLDLLCSRKFRSELIFRMLKSGLTDVSLTDISALENYCYKWTVDGEIWESEFTAPDDALDSLEAIRKTVIEPVFALRKKLSKKCTAKKICTLIYEHLVSGGIEKNVGRMMSGLINSDRAYEAAEIKRLWGCLIDILDSICETLDENEMSFSEAAKLMKSMIGRINYSVPPQTLDAVMTASARTARLNAPKAVFIMGANDGDFPNQVTVHGLFSEPDRQKLAEKDLLVSTPLADLIAAERLVVYKSVSAPSEKLFISYPLSDLSGQTKYPAQIIDSIIKMFGTDRIRLTEDDIPVHYYAATLHSAFYHYMQNRESNTPSAAAVEQLLMSRPDYKRRLIYVLSRSGHEQEYLIESEIMEKLKSFSPLRLSSTGLEEYDLCHFKFFCDKCLGLHPREKIELDARIAGELTHECFFGLLSSRSKQEFISMSYEDMREEIGRKAEEYRNNKLAGDFGKDAKFGLIFSKLTDRLSEVFIHTQQSLMASDFVPHKFELDLRESHSVVLPFGNGKQLSFGGIVDRADICKINGRDYVRIVDYKSSRKNITAETLGCGINMQMLLYLFASADKGGIYEGCEPAGVLYSPVQVSEVKLESHRVDSFNSSAVESSLKTSGLVLGDMDVLNAMEKDIAGRYIPVKLTKSGEIDARSGCISGEGMEKLKEYTYGKLTAMAESLYSGDVAAEPLLIGGALPCAYCDYINICDNSKLERFRLPDEAEVSKAERILSMKFPGKESGDNGMD